MPRSVMIGVSATPIVVSLRITTNAATTRSAMTGPVRWGFVTGVEPVRGVESCRVIRWGSSRASLQTNRGLAHRIPDPPPFRRRGLG